MVFSLQVLESTCGSLPKRQSKRMELEIYEVYLGSRSKDEYSTDSLCLALLARFSLSTVRVRGRVQGRADGE